MSKKNLSETLVSDTIFLSKENHIKKGVYICPSSLSYMSSISHKAMKSNKNYIKPIEADDVDVLLANRQIKQQNAKLSSFINSFPKGVIDMSDGTKDRITSCASFMEFLKGQGVDAETGELTGEKKIMTNGFFCGNRFCPICSKNKARKDAIRLKTMMKALEEKDNQAFLFLTLTVPNCSGADLSSTIDRMNKAFNYYFSKYKDYKACVNGSIKKVEVTYNSNKNSSSFDTYHPHFHILLSVDKDYFYNPRKYIKHSKWLDLWRKAMKDNSISQVNVKKADLTAVMEMSKYMAKDSDYLYSDSVFLTFYKALKGKRLLTFAGNFKTALSDYESGSLDDWKFEDFLITEDYYESKWNNTVSDYDNGVFKLASLDPQKMAYISDRLALRGYAIEDMQNGKYRVFYIGKTTYGEELTDE